jgi:hypothetical protein
MVADAEPLPFLKCAVLCERLLIEKDGALSAIRIFDRVGAEVPFSADSSAPRVLIEGHFLISLIRGQTAKSHTVGMVVRSPSGQTIGQPQLYPFDFLDGEDAVANLTIQLKIDVWEDGIHWFLLSIDERPVTEISLRIAITVKDIQT